MKKNTFFLLAAVTLLNLLGACGTGESSTPKPPALVVVAGEEIHPASLGTYTWRRLHLGGMEEVCADSPHPLDCQEFLPLLKARQARVRLQFAKAPDDPLSARCWSDRQWGNPLADSQEVIITGDTLPLRPGGWIYEVTARWGSEHGPGGEASYAFYAMGPSLPNQT